MTQQASSSSSAAPSSSRFVFCHDEIYDAEPFSPFSYSSVSSEDALIIDNGSHHMRAGFSSQSTPYVDEPNIVSRYTSRKSNKMLLFGRDCEIDHASRSNIRSAFDGDFLVGFDVLENTLDCTFLRLGINTPSISHPIYMTERLASPLYCRSQTSELLFELYGAPSVCYGVDSLMAFSNAGNIPGGDGKPKRDGLVINLGNVTSSVIPVLNGKGLMNRAKRMPWGGSQASELMLKLAQLKYPAFPTKVTMSQATFMVRETAYFSSDYPTELESLSDPEKLSEIDRVIQFDYVLPEVNLKTEEEVARTAEKRREQGRKLQEMQAKQRAEKAMQRELQLMELKELKESNATLDPKEFITALEDAGFDEEADLDKAIRVLEISIKKTKKSDLDLDGAEEEGEPTFPLVDVPDQDLDEEQKKEKRKQRMMKGAHLARQKLKDEKQAEKDKLLEEQRLDDEAREADIAGWSRKLRGDHAATIARMKERKKKRAMLGDRKSAVAQNRMKSIANLASDSPVNKKRKRGSDDDGFGQDDADWAVYRQIDGEEDSDAEADDLALVQDIETKLLKHDETFTTDDTIEAQRTRQTALISAFLRGKEKYDPDDVAQSYQLHLNVERIRVPEVWFQPAIAGVDSAGIAEIAGWLLNGFSDEERRRMQQCIYVTGGSSLIPGFKERLHKELTSLLPFREPFQIVTSYPADTRLEPWKGMAAWSRTAEAKRAAVTRAEWLEKGGDYLKEHSWGNWSDDHGHSAS